MRTLPHPYTSVKMQMRRIEAEGKAQSLRAGLLALVRSLEPGAKLPKVAELCEGFAVARRTLDAVLRQLESEGVIVRRHAVGIFVSESAPARQTHLALVCRPSFVRAAHHSPVWDVLVDGIQERAKECDDTFEFFFAREGSSPTLAPELMRQVESGMLSAVLGVGLPEEGAHWLMERGVPVINLFSVGNVTVMIDGVRSVELGVAALRERGAQTIGLWMPAPFMLDGDSGEWMPQQNNAAFRDALKRNGLPFESRHVQMCMQAATSLAEQGFEIAQRVFSAPRDEWPDAVFCSDDLVTHGALVAMRQMNIRVGRDVQLASHANVGSPVLMGEDELVLVEIDPAQLVATMFDHLDVLLTGPFDPTQVEEVLVAPQLRARPRPT